MWYLDWIYALGTDQIQAKRPLRIIKENVFMDVSEKNTRLNAFISSVPICENRMINGKISKVVIRRDTPDFFNI